MPNIHVRKNRITNHNDDGDGIQWRAMMHKPVGGGDSCGSGCVNRSSCQSVTSFHVFMIATIAVLVRLYGCYDSTAMMTFNEFDGGSIGQFSKLQNQHQ